MQAVYEPFDKRNNSKIIALLLQFFD